MPLIRRSLLLGSAASLLAAPAIVRAASLMAVKRIDAELVDGFGDLEFLWRNQRPTTETSQHPFD